MDSSLAVFIVLGSSIIGLVYFYLVWNFNYWKSRNVNGPKPTILFGNLPSLVRKHRNYNFEVSEIYEKFKKTGDRFIGIFMTRNPVVLLLDPLLARDILTNKFKSFSNNELSLWGNRKTEKVSIHHPFITRTDEDWKERRNDFIAGISDSKLQQTYPILTQINHRMTNFINTEIVKTGGIIEIESLSYKYVVDFVANFVYGIDANVFTSGIPTNPMYNHSRNLMDLSFKQIEQFYLLGLVPCLKKIVKDRFFDQDTDNYFIDMQKIAIDMRLKNKNDRFDFLNYVLKLQEKKNLSNMDVVVHSMSVVLDAVDTTAFVILHTLFLVRY
ncbi:probable cytochrome P450 28a5 [Episyrphus balteatus]|uniref:probable cytochrome P450 28a5 n=1 Tax=Episyrphus balteatus TaxID=286459 RepID=UPI0024863DE6|nr:probable cytochrome P450 28a5 [Episyrphus balteatus]